MDRRATKVLLIHPEFGGTSFWNNRESCRKVGAKYPSAPLGLITVAAMLPEDWTVRLIDRNTRDLSDADILAADLVMIGAMFPQSLDALRMIKRVKALGVPVCAGGPDPTSRQSVYEEAEFIVAGEAEGAIDAFIADWRAGATAGRYRAPKFKIDVTKTPRPRYDLLNFEDYLYVCVQFSRGCPFMCEFCDIIELYGRVPRAKEADQLLGELDRLYELGYRGHVDFVDDNLIGNKKAVKLFLPRLIEWQRKRGYPFEFSTEASLNLADDQELLTLLAEARFFVIFIGVESPDDDVLAATKKKQNTRRNIAENVRRIQDAGIMVIAGFIVGFDGEKGSVAKPMTALIEEAAIPVAIIGLLYALPNTQLSRRLQQEGRLHRLDAPQDAPEFPDQCAVGLNFETDRPREEILADYRDIVATIYRPGDFFGRATRAALALNITPTRRALNPRRAMKDLSRFFSIVWAVQRDLAGARLAFWRMLASVLLRNPTGIRAAMNSAILYLHLGPFSKVAAEAIDLVIEDIRAGQRPAPSIMPSGSNLKEAIPSKATINRGFPFGTPKNRLQRAASDQSQMVSE